MITGNFEYCPNCGSKYHVGNVFPLTCTSCKAVQYHNSKPTAAAIIVENGKVLLVIRAGEPAKGEYDVPGGFLEYGELPQEGIIREVREELGVEIEIEEFLGFYVTDYEAGVKCLDCFFAVRIVKGIPKAADDIAGIEWVDLEDLPNIYNKMSLIGPKSALREIYQRWLKTQEK